MGKALVNTDHLTGLVSQLRTAIPKDIEEAQEILQQREGLINQALIEASRIRTQTESEMQARIEGVASSKEARTHAEKIIREARDQSNKTIKEAEELAGQTIARAEQLAQQSITEAERQSKRTRDDAESFAQDRTTGADQYARDVLLLLEEEVSRLLGSVRKGIDTLSQEREVTA